MNKLLRATKIRIEYELPYNEDEKEEAKQLVQQCKAK